MPEELKPLHHLDDVERVLADSHHDPVLLFKHSRTCGISAEALDELRDHLEQHQAAPGRIRYAMVTVQTHRDVSNAIAARLGVRHETPQAILVHGGRAIWTASHFRVNAVEIANAVRNASAS